MATTTGTFLATRYIHPLPFVKFNDTISSFGTALGTAFPGITMQVNADTTSGNTSNALVILNENTAYSVPPNYWFGRTFEGQWTVWPDAKMQGGAASQYTPLPYSGS